ncbi:MAG: hypothetical protein SGPRY_000204 [Prymnesium sp.]
MELCHMPAAALRSFDPGSSTLAFKLAKSTLMEWCEHKASRELKQYDRGVRLSAMCLDACTQIVHSNLDNQIEHLTLLLKWRMDRTTEEDPQMALWRATDDLHNKTLENYRRWVKYVNVQQRNARESNVESSEIEFDSWISVSALSGSAWDFFGMWGFTSDINESSWVCNAQLHQLLLCVHSMLPAGCAQTKGPGLTVVPGTPRQAYAHFQKLLKKATMSDDSVSSLKRYFKKTYCE